MNNSRGGAVQAANTGEILEWQFSQVFGERVPGEAVQEGEHAILF